MKAFYDTVFHGKGEVEIVSMSKHKMVNVRFLTGPLRELTARTHADCIVLLDGESTSLLGVPAGMMTRDGVTLTATVQGVSGGEGE